MNHRIAEQHPHERALHIELAEIDQRKSLIRISTQRHDHPLVANQILWIGDGQIRCRQIPHHHRLIRIRPHQFQCPGQIPALDLPRLILRRRRIRTRGLRNVRELLQIRILNRQLPIPREGSIRLKIEDQISIPRLLNRQQILLIAQREL